MGLQGRLEISGMSTTVTRAGCTATEHRASRASASRRDLPGHRAQGDQNEPCHR
jgi:hypothetical protein